MRCCALLWLVAGCSDPGASLRVDLRTDYVAGDAFDSVRLRISRPDSAVVHSDDITVSTSDDFIAGARLTLVEDLAAATVTVAVTLERAGAVVASREVTVELDGLTTITVVISCTPASGPCATDVDGGMANDGGMADGGMADLGETGLCTTDEDCDDGQFCTGPASCEAGECILAGDPCGGSTVCDEPTDSCVGCSTNADCASGEICTDSRCECDETARSCVLCSADSDCDAGQLCMDGWCEP